MELIVNGTPDEIADFVSALQDLRGDIIVQPREITETVGNKIFSISRYDLVEENQTKR